eukprot:403368730
MSFQPKLNQSLLAQKVSLKSSLNSSTTDQLSTSTTSNRNFIQKGNQINNKKPNSQGPKLKSTLNSSAVFNAWNNNNKSDVKQLKSNNLSQNLTQRVPNSARETQNKQGKSGFMAKLLQAKNQQKQLNLTQNIQPQKPLNFYTSKQLSSMNLLELESLQNKLEKQKSEDSAKFYEETSQLQNQIKFHQTEINRIKTFIQELEKEGAMLEQSLRDMSQTSFDNDQHYRNLKQIHDYLEGAYISDSTNFDCLNQELIQLEHDCNFLESELCFYNDTMIKESEEEHKFYQEYILKHEIMNIQAKKGVYFMTYEKPQSEVQIMCQIYELENYGINQSNFDRYFLEQSMPIDRFKTFQEYFCNLILDQLLGFSQFKLYVQNITVISLSDSFFHHLVDYVKSTHHSHYKNPKNSEFDSITIQSYTFAQNNLTLQLANLPFSQSSNFSDKSLYILKRIKMFLQQIQNDQQDYIINRKLNDFAKGCEMTKRIMQLVSHKEVIIVVSEQEISGDGGNSGVMGNKEFMQVVSQLRKIKFFNY